jgi:hypothetical protein
MSFRTTGRAVVGARSRDAVATSCHPGTADRAAALAGHLLDGVVEADHQKGMSSSVSALPLRSRSTKILLANFSAAS